MLLLIVLSFMQLAEAAYEYGKGDHMKVFDTLGPDFDALDYKVGTGSFLLL